MKKILDYASAAATILSAGRDLVREFKKPSEAKPEAEIRAEASLTERCLVAEAKAIRLEAELLECTQRLETKQTEASSNMWNQFRLWCIFWHSRKASFDSLVAHTVKPGYAYYAMISNGTDGTEIAIREHAREVIENTLRNVSWNSPDPKVPDWRPT